eukprot:7291190-Pyramimonas_sp.AAC.1
MPVANPAAMPALWVASLLDVGAGFAFLCEGISKMPWVLSCKTCKASWAFSAASWAFGWHSWEPRRGVEEKSGPCCGQVGAGGCSDFS